MSLKMSEGCRAILICILVIYAITVFIIVACFHAPIAMDKVYYATQDLLVEVVGEKDDFYIVKSLEEIEYIPIRKESLYYIPKDSQLLERGKIVTKKDEIAKIHFDWKSVNQNTNEIGVIYLFDSMYENVADMNQKRKKALEEYLKENR